MHRQSLIDRLVQRHAARAQSQLLRRLRTIDGAKNTRIVIDGRELVSFASNDYLGLAGHAATRAALVQAADEWGVGATAAHLLGGHRAPHAQLEHALADWTQRPRAMLFSSGWMANLGVVSTLLERGDLCVQDKLNHASLLDAARLAGCELKRYLHADVASAQRQLAALPDAAAMLATDSVFSMDGDVAPLAELAALCSRQQVTLYVDDAHGIGVRGPDGGGSVLADGLGIDAVPLYMATLGKALGGFGAFVAGSAAVIDALAQFARTQVYSTAMPPALAAATAAAIEVAQFESWRRDKLALLIAHFRAGALKRGLQLIPSSTPIQPLLTGDSGRAVAIAAAVEAAGFFVPAIRPPTVAEGSARLRITLCALHQECELDQLLDAIAHALQHAAPADAEATAGRASPASARAARGQPRSTRRKRP